jgi:hypothetical protein
MDNSTNMFKSTLETLKSYLVVGVLVFLFIYASFGMYLKYLAHDAVDQAIHTIETTDPNISNIQYRHLQFSPIDFFKQQLTLKGISFHLNNPNTNVGIDALTLQHFMGFTKDPLGAFEVNFKGAHVDQFAGLYGMITTWLNNPYLYSELGNVPNALKLNLDGSANYIPNNNHEVDLTLTLKNKNMELFTYQIMVNNLNLTPAFFNTMPAFLSIIQQSQIMHVHYQADIDYVLTPTELANLSPGFAQYLGNLGYQNLPLSIRGNSDYSAKDTQETYHFNVAIENMGALTAAINYQIVNPPSLAKSIGQLLGTTNNTQALAPDLIQSATLSYQDASLTHRIIQNMAQNSGATLADTQNGIITMINGLSRDLAIPQMNAMAMAINSFILNPQNLTLNLQPTTPFSFDDIANFFVAQQQRNQVIQQNLSKLNGDGRTKAYGSYLQQSFTAYSDFFNRIGLSVTANSNS